MNSVFRSLVNEERRLASEKLFGEQLQRSLVTFLEKQLTVEMNGPFAFDYKEVKAQMSGEIVMCTITAADMSGGKTHFLMSKEHAGTLADLLNMGDGSASFSADEHLEPLRDMLKEVMSSYVGEAGKLYGNHLICDEAKAIVLDISPADFVGSWTVTQLAIGPNPELSILRISANELLDTLFPAAQDKGSTQKTSERSDELDPELRRDMALVMDIELPIAIELGRTNLLIRDIIKLAPGSVVELDKLSGEPVDLYVNGKKFARGEVVVVEENFAVRITELVNPQDRATSLKN
ncbi:flagellar motor switch protein FliN [bacterium]|nr:flagellar motor switch protein FliN [bacterium]